MTNKDIFLCADHREYLQSYLAGQKPSQGLRALARKAGLKSPGHLSLLVQGERRLTLRSAQLLAKGLALKGRKRSLFLAFARLDSARSDAERAAARETIVHLRSFREEHRLSAKQFSFLATWYYPVIYGMIENNPAGSDPAYLAERLGRGVSVAQAEEALRDLEFLGLIEKNDAGLRTKHAALTTPPELRDLAAAKYHRNALRLAEDSLELPLGEREFGGLTVAVPRKLLPVVKEKLRAFRGELNELLSREAAPADIYQLNMQLFPLTKDIERITQ